MVLLFWLWLSLPQQEKLDSLLAYARYLYNHRHLADTNFIHCRKIWEGVLNSYPHNEEALRGLAEMNQYLASQTKDRTEKLRCLTRGLAFAETLIKVNDKNPWGHFWYAANYGEICRIRGVMKSLTAIPKLKAEFSKVLELDPENFDAFYALGMIYLETPELAGGNKKKALDYFQKAIAIDSNYTLPYIDLAKYYISKNELPIAKKLLNRVLFTKKPVYPADYFLNDRLIAESLLAKIESGK